MTPPRDVAESGGATTQQSGSDRTRKAGGDPTQSAVQEKTEDKAVRQFLVSKEDEAKAQQREKIRQEESHVRQSTTREIQML